MKPVAVTGGIASGKSTVVSALADLGFATASADQIARDVIGQPETVRRLKDALGVAQLPERRELARLVATDADARRAVDRVMHPLIMEVIVKSRSRVVEVPLLFEACVQRFFSVSIAVACDHRTQVGRVIARGFEPTVAEDMVRSQLGAVARTSLADFVLRTDRPIGTVLEDVRQIGQVINKLAPNDVLYSPVEPGVDSEQA